MTDIEENTEIHKSEEMPTISHQCVNTWYFSWNQWIYSNYN